MLTLIYIISLLVLLLAPLLWLAWWPYRQKKRIAHELRQQFAALAAQHRLNFSSQEILGDVMIGLDGQQRLLLVVAYGSNAAFRSNLINLNHIHSGCVVRYHQSQENSSAAQPSAVHLQLKLLARLPVDIVFYEEGRDKKRQWKQLENKARQWELLLTKMRTPAEPA